MWNFMLRTEATIPSDAAMEPSTIVYGDGCRDYCGVCSTLVPMAEDGG